MAKDDFIEKVWKVIMADPERVQKSWGLTNHTINPLSAKRPNLAFKGTAGG